jgi:hypothetical protein
MTATKRKASTKQAAAERRLTDLTNVEIDGHPLLDQEQRKICKNLRNIARKEQQPFRMLDFAEISLRATGNDYAATSGQNDYHQAARLDNAHRQAAILYVYEAVKTGPPIIAETAGERGTLRDLELLARLL